MDTKIICVLPTIRPESGILFKEAWKEQFEKYNVELLIVKDGEKPELHLDGKDFKMIPRKIPSKFFTTFNTSIRNIGFCVAKELEATHIFTLDDDCYPEGDTIGDHLRALDMKVPTTWFPISEINSNGDYTRGFPYGKREESEVMLSHGVWSNVPDRDAPNQLVTGNQPMKYFKGAIPKGVLFPFCGMNFMFKIEALPYIMMAPVGGYPGAEHFDDIWAGTAFKPDFDTLNWAVVTGYSSVVHKRASDPFKNLSRQHMGIRIMEDMSHEWYQEFLSVRKKWHAYHSEIQ